MGNLSTREVLEFLQGLHFLNYMRVACIKLLLDENQYQKPTYTNGKDGKHDQWYEKEKSIRATAKNIETFVNKINSKFPETETLLLLDNIV